MNTNDRKLEPVYISLEVCVLYVYIHKCMNFFSVEIQKTQAGSRMHITGRIYTIFILSLFFFSVERQKAQAGSRVHITGLVCAIFILFYFQLNTAKHKLDPVRIFLDVLHIFCIFQLKASKHTLDFVYA